jgi:hypothetical protein
VDRESIDADQRALVVVDLVLVTIPRHVDLRLEPALAIARLPPRAPTSSIPWRISASIQLVSAST